MAQKFTRVKEDAFQTMQLNAGILLDDFDPSSLELLLEALTLPLRRNTKILGRTWITAPST